MIFFVQLFFGNNTMKQGIRFAIAAYKPISGQDIL